MSAPITSSTNTLAIGGNEGQGGVANAFTAGLTTLETMMNNQIQQISSNANPSQADLMLLQSMTIKWQTLVQSETGVLKAIGDTMRTVTSNIGG